MTRRRIALIGVFAVLLQVFLFGWHTHPFQFDSDGRQPAISSAGASLSPAAADDDCELCAALHHLTAAPGEFILATLPPSAALPASSIAAQPFSRTRVPRPRPASGLIRSISSIDPPRQRRGSAKA